MNLDRKMSYINGKVLTILGLLALFSIALFFVYSINQGRQSRQNDVAQEIQEKYAYSQTITTPYIETTSFLGLDTNIYTPEEVTVDVETKTSLKSRGIFKVPVYTSQVTMTGEFKLPSDANGTLNIYSSDYQNISDLKNSFNTRTFRPTELQRSENAPGLYQQQIISDQTNQEFRITFEVKGSQKLQFVPTSQDTNLTINSDWESPSFIGYKLPDQSQINPDGFTATWNTKAAETTISELKKQGDFIDESIGFVLYQPNDIYTKTTRSIKYGIFVIALVFFSFLAVEILSGKKVNNLQYILIGLSLVIYYSLLLSLGEIIGFTIAYIIASLSTIFLNTAFTKLILKKFRYSLSISAILSAIYIMVYLILQTTQYTLLIGSISAYIIIAVSMLATYFMDFETNNSKQI